VTLLSVIQDAATDLNLSRPSSVINSTDQQVIQLLSLLKRDGLDLVRRFDWQVLLTEATFTTVATQAQTTLATVAPDFFRIVDDTMFNRTQMWKVFGPLSPQEWQRRLSLGAQVGVNNAFRIYGNSIYFYPVPEAGDSIYFEYVSNKWVAAVDTTAKAAFTVDTDTARLDEDILTLGVKWRFLKAKGLDYSEEFRSYEAALESVFGADGGRGPVDMTGDTLAEWTLIPDGNWAIT
jgi:hypothetical protein